jgi:hypothetical protein
MTWLFAGSELESFRLTGSLSNYAFLTGSTWLDTALSKAAIMCNGNAGDDAYADFADQTEVWAHMHLTTNNNGLYAAPYAALMDSATGSNRVQLEAYSASSVWYLRLGYWNGASFTYLTTVPIGPQSQYEVDIHVKLDGAAGAVEFYVDGTLIGSFSGDTSAIATAFNALRLINVYSYEPGFSQVIIGDGAQSTAGLRLMTLQPSGVGAANGWTDGSAYSRLTDSSDSTTISSDTDGQVSQYSCNAVASGNYDVLSVWVNGRAQNAAGGIQNLQLGVRSNSADTFSGNVSGLATSYGPVKASWDTNPNNSNSPWTVSDLNSIQIGVKAIS